MPITPSLKSTLKKGVYWSDGTEFTADDVIYTLDTYFAGKGKLTYFGVPTIDAYVKSYKKIDNYTVQVETTHPAYDFATTLGVYTWGSAFNIVPKHVFEKQTDLAAFKNTNPVTLGAYTIKAFDPNGQWHLWQRRDDWQRSSTGAWARRRRSTSSTRTSAMSKPAPWRSSRTSTTSTLS